MRQIGAEKFGSMGEEYLCYHERLCEVLKMYRSYGCVHDSQVKERAA